MSLTGDLLRAAHARGGWPEHDRVLAKLMEAAYREGHATGTEDGAENGGGYPSDDAWKNSDTANNKLKIEGT